MDERRGSPQDARKTNRAPRKNLARLHSALRRRWDAELASGVSPTPPHVEHHCINDAGAHTERPAVAEHDMAKIRAKGLRTRQSGATTQYGRR